MLSLVLLTAALTPDASACAGIFHAEDTLAESDTQEIILEELDDGMIEVSYRAVYHGDSASFGWIIPIPGEATALEDGDSERFSSFRASTSPVVHSYYEDLEESSKGCSRSNAKSGDAMNGMDTGEVRAGGDTIEVVGEGFTGTYEYALLAASDASELQDWLTENGWSVGGASSELEAYVAEGWQFAVLEVAPSEAETYEDGRELPPVVVTYDGDMVFPARMARSAGASDQRTTLYVIGDQRATIASGWNEVAMEDLEGDIGDEPEALFRDALDGYNASAPTYAVTWADNDGIVENDRWLTRFDTLAEASDHTADPVFALDGGEDVERVVIELYEGAATGGSRSGLWFLMLPLMGFGWSLRRR